MIIATWSDKGGVGKSTIATTIAQALGLHLFDLDPQGDAARWCKRAEQPYTVLDENTYASILSEKANSHDVVVVDCPPGHDRRSLFGAGLAGLVILPTRSGDSDLVAMGRSLELLTELKAKGNPDLLVGVVLNYFRNTARSSATAEALAKTAEIRGYHYLGELGHRTAFEEAYADGRSPLVIGGSAAHEARKIVEAVRLILRSFELQKWERR